MHVEPLRIRPYKDDDLEAVLALHELALRGTGALLDPGPWDEDLTRIPSTYLESGGTFLVGEVHEGLVAMGALRPVDAETAEIKRMRVHPEQQRRGYGTAIFLELQEESVRQGFKRLVLETTVQQIAARHLYKRLGFHEVGRTERLGLAVVIMERSL